MEAFCKKIKRSYYKLFRYGDSMIQMSLYGKFRVKYKEGEISQPFDWKTAKDYKDMFGGEIIDNF